MTFLAGIVAFLIVTGFMANAGDFPSRRGHRPGDRLPVVLAVRLPGTLRTVSGQCQGGHPPVLVVPAGKPVMFEVTSADVIHAFWLPDQRFKISAYPGQVNTFTITYPKPGQWLGPCAQLRGIYHYEMDFYVRAVPSAAFLRKGTS